jgi:hypothetical protein
MKTTSNALLLICVAMSSMMVASPDFIEQAIQNGKIDVIKTCIETKYAVSASNKQKYGTLAQKLVNEKKEAQVKLTPYFTLDAISLALALGTIVALAGDSIDSYSSGNWKSKWLCALALIKVADSTNKFIKDSLKFRDEATKDGVAEAEKVAKAVAELPVNPTY